MQSARIMSHTSMHPITHESCHAHQCIISHTNHVKHINASYHTHQCIISHTIMLHTSMHLGVWRMNIHTCSLFKSSPDEDFSDRAPATRPCESWPPHECELAHNVFAGVGKRHCKRDFYVREPRTARATRMHHDSDRHACICK